LMKKKSIPGLKKKLPWHELFQPHSRHVFTSNRSAFPTLLAGDNSRTKRMSKVGKTKTYGDGPG